MPKPCKTCGKHGHSAAFCYQTRKKVPTTRKQINKVGKETRAWSEFRKHYLMLHPPNHEGYYECYICHKWVLANEITLDHVVARSSDPSLRYNEDNIRLCCYECNARKVSQSLDRYLQKKV